MKLMTFVSLFLAGLVLAPVAVLAARAAFGPPTEGDKRLIALDKQSKDAEKLMHSRSAYDIRKLSDDKITELAKKLSKEDAEILLKKGTEPPGCGTLLDNKKEGTYTCKLCGLPLFSSSAKFNSGTGWPSFYQPFDKDHVHYERDTAFGMTRVEITCQRCRGHLGHVFEDGPPPTGLRYCLNSASLNFVDKGEKFPAESLPVATATAYFAGGCFWGVEDRLQQTPGVISAESGYMGGTLKSPTYKQVCSGTTGHTETVKVVFDPKTVEYSKLVELFFKYHDPTTLNRQGPDVGTQYRSAIFTTDAAQEADVKKVIETLSKTDRFKTRPIVTEVVSVAKAGAFYAAEDYHQDYHEKNGGHCALPEH